MVFFLKLRNTSVHEMENFKAFQCTKWKMWGRLLGYNSSLSSVVWGDGDSGFALFGESYFQGGAGEPVDPVELDV